MKELKVLNLLDEIEEMISSSSGFPLTGKIVIDGEELKDIVREIREVLPEEIEHAQLIMIQQDAILSDAKTEYEAVIKDARMQADMLIDENDITMKARRKAAEILDNAEEKARQLKLGTYEYMDNILFDFQNRVSEMNEHYFVDMFTTIDSTFSGVSETLLSNREEIQRMAYEVNEGVSTPKFDMDEE